jgi:hypothetical protein
MLGAYAKDIKNIQLIVSKKPVPEAKRSGIGNLNNPAKRRV